MLKIVLTSKLTGGRLSGIRPRYEGSLRVDSRLLAAAGIEPFEQIHVLNLNNGVRLETYAIRGPAGSGVLELNGPASRLGLPGDEITVLAYGLSAPGERVRPRIVLLKGRNRIAKLVHP